MTSILSQTIKGIRELRDRIKISEGKFKEPTEKLLSEIDVIMSTLNSLKQINRIESNIVKAIQNVQQVVGNCYDFLIKLENASKPKLIKNAREYEQEFESLLKKLHRQGDNLSTALQAHNVETTEGNKEQGSKILATVKSHEQHDKSRTATLQRAVERNETHILDAKKDIAEIHKQQTEILSTVEGKTEKVLLALEENKQHISAAGTELAKTKEQSAKILDTAESHKQADGDHMEKFDERLTTLETQNQEILHTLAAKEKESKKWRYLPFGAWTFSILHLLIGLASVVCGTTVCVWISGAEAITPRLAGGFYLITVICGFISGFRSSRKINKVVALIVMSVLASLFATVQIYLWYCTGNDSIVFSMVMSILSSIIAAMHIFLQGRTLYLWCLCADYSIGAFMTMSVLSSIFAAVQTYLQGRVVQLWYCCDEDLFPPVTVNLCIIAAIFGLGGFLASMLSAVLCWKTSMANKCGWTCYVCCAVDHHQ